MITANELRTGNLVLQDGVYARIYSISLAMFNDNINDISVNKDTGMDLVTKKVRFEPIPLTTEILEKCGFEAASNYHPEGKVFKIKGFEIAPLYHMVDYVQSGDRIRIQNIEHLHQLQNLYYALIGTELEINL